MATSKRKNDEWSPQSPDQERAPEAPAERAREGQDGQSPNDVDDHSADFDRDLVARRAYDRYLARGGGDGQDVDDWLTAERETLAGKDEPERDTES